MTDYVVVFITAGSLEEARKISDGLLADHLVACCNLVSPVQSLFHWQGKICDEQEVLIVAKTKTELFEKIIPRTKELHSYEVPEIIALPILAGSDSYLSWIEDECGAAS